MPFKVVVERAENAASGFDELLELIKEIQENCIATRGDNISLIVVEKL